jgi:hypothetical protein
MAFELRGLCRADLFLSGGRKMGINSPFGFDHHAVRRRALPAVPCRAGFAADIFGSRLICLWPVIAFVYMCDRPTVPLRAVLCKQQVFAERFEGDVLVPMASRTGRLEHIVHHLGLALGGRSAAGIAQRLMLPVSNDTLLRVVRRRALAVIGIDDFAWRRNHRYGTIVCDLERRRVVISHVPGA